MPDVSEVLSEGYCLSEIFQKQLDDFILQACEREEKFFDGCDLELAALTSRKDYRKGLGTALVSSLWTEPWLMEPGTCGF